MKLHKFEGRETLSKRVNGNQYFIHFFGDVKEQNLEEIKCVYDNIRPIIDLTHIPILI